MKLCDTLLSWRLLKLITSMVALTLISACVEISNINEGQFKLELGEERVQSGEADLIDQIVAIHSEIQEQVEMKQSPVPRGQHPKQHGCVTAEFIVEPGIPNILKHGVFQNPHTFRAVIRFSNGRAIDDTKADAHGMAVKLLGVEGPKVKMDGNELLSQDFVMIDNPVFFVRNVEDYIPLMKDFRSVAIGGFINKSLTGLKFLLSPARQFRLLRTVASKRPDSLLTVQYWSTTPSKFGNTAMKFSVKPSGDILVAETEKKNSKDKLRLAMSAHLQSKPASFDFLVQLQTDAEHMPVEDPTIVWDESISPFIKVATILIPVQTFESVEQMKFCENLSFTPWHSLEDFRPLGGINRARKKVYEVLSKRRREANGD